ncbi:hypothetical protein CC86DRAFT_48067 [Ophiobolus disseminans]|uniref:F-box domain-containing protein n=1 Tax=Ophiobolus disseminans TaxID=1469910 RepID=A0A6A6ZWW3_9PLEO|nr:hypothetical protein CC86DRAFT_48067 [Ophiobolus disseminans]
MQGYGCNEEQKDYSMDPWQSCIPLIPSLHNLRAVSLKFTNRVCNPDRERPFYNYCGTESVPMRTHTLRQLFAALDHTHLNVETLSIENLQDYTPHVYTEPSFQNVRAKLKGLHLNIAMEYSEHGPDQDSNIPDKHTFFNRQLNAHWLAPTQKQLTHLTLYGDSFWGVYPRWDPRGLHFPALKSLSLGNWSIAHEWQVDWILSHVDTLEELYLDDCPIVHALRFEQNQYGALEWAEGELSVKDYGFEAGYMYPSLRWSRVLPLFTSHLKKLKRFGMAHGPWMVTEPREGDGNHAFARRYELPARLEVGRYCIHDCGVLPTHWIVEDEMFTEHGFVWDEEDIKTREDDVVEQELEGMWDVEDEEEEEKIRHPGGREEEKKALDQLVAGLQT